MPSFVVEVEKTVIIRKFARVASARDAADAGALIAGRSDAHDTAIVSVPGEWTIEKVGKAVVRNVYEGRTHGYTVGGADSE